MRSNSYAAVFVALALLMSGRIATGAADLSKFSLVPTFKLAPEVTPEPVPLRWAGGWVLARVKINGLDAGWFKIGTGWKDSAIDSAVAARLKLQKIPEFGLVTPTRQPRQPITKSGVFRADSLQCGQASAGDVPLEVVDLSAMSKESMKMNGEGISGVLGWDLLRTLPFLLDEPALQLTWQGEAKPADLGGCHLWSNPRRAFAACRRCQAQRSPPDQENHRARCSPCPPRPNAHLSFGSPRPLK